MKESEGITKKSEASVSTEVAEEKNNKETVESGNSKTSEDVDLLDGLSNSESNIVEVLEGNPVVNEVLEDSGVTAKEQKKLVLERVVKAVKFVGPLPPPKLLKDYSKIPNAAETVIYMAKSEMEHRHKIEDKLSSADCELQNTQAEYIRATINLKTRLQMFGFVITVLLIIVGAISLFLDKPVGAIVTFISAIGSFVAVMFYKKDPDEVDEKTEEENSSRNE